MKQVILKDEPLVSVLMTSYNREKYISFAIESILRSSFVDFELIIVDDGSKDNTVNIASSYAKKDSRIKFFQNERNLGDYPNRNKAASYAKGKYLKYVDSDDYLYPWALEVIVNMMEQFPNAGFGFCSMEPNESKVFPLVLSPKEAYEYHYFGPGLFRRAPLSSIIKREIFNQEGGFRPIRMAGDFEMWQRLSQKYDVVLMPEGMVWYRKHGEQEVNDYRKFINTYEQIKVDYLKDNNCPLEKKDSKKILKTEKKLILRFIFINLIKFEFDILKINLRNLKIYNS